MTSAGLCLMLTLMLSLPSAEVALVDVGPVISTSVKIRCCQDVGLGGTARHFVDSLIVNRTIAA